MLLFFAIHISNKPQQSLTLDIDRRTDHYTGDPNIDNTSSITLVIPAWTRPCCFRSDVHTHSLHLPPPSKTNRCLHHWSQLVSCFIYKRASITFGDSVLNDNRVRYSSLRAQTIKHPRLHIIATNITITPNKKKRKNKNAAFANL